MKGKTIGQRLREIRLAAGMTQKQVAEGLGKNTGWTHDVECGRINLNIRLVCEWAKVCGFAVEWNFVPLPEQTEEYTIIPTE